MRRIAIVLALLLAACSGDDDRTDVTTTTTEADVTTTTTASSGSTSTAPESPFGATPVSTPAEAQQVILAKLDVGLHSGFERVVFRFREPNAAIGYSVKHADPPFKDSGQGATVNVSGSGHIAVRIIGAAHDEEGKSSYPDPQRVKGQDVITEVVRIDDYEGIVNFVIGTEGDRAFRVFTLQNPARLVIDVQGP